MTAADRIEALQRLLVQAAELAGSEHHLVEFGFHHVSDDMLNAFVAAGAVRRRYVDLRDGVIVEWFTVTTNALTGPRITLYSRTQPVVSETK